MLNVKFSGQLELHDLSTGPINHVFHPTSSVGINTVFRAWSLELFCVDRSNFYVRVRHIDAKAGQIIVRLSQIDVRVDEIDAIASHRLITKTVQLYDRVRQIDIGVSQVDVRVGDFKI